MRLPLLLFAALAGPTGAQSRGAPARDVEGYAVATCLARQSDPMLRRQGQGWASAIVQRGRGDPALMKPVEQAVDATLEVSRVPVVREDGPQPTELELTIMYCGELIDHPTVRRAIARAIGRLTPAYRDRRR